MPLKRPHRRHHQAFQHEVDIAFAPVVGCVSYLDTIEVITGWKDGTLAMRLLSQHGIKWVKSRNPHPRMPRTLRIQRPSRTVLEQLPPILGRFELVRVDLAVDLLFADSPAANAQALALQAFLQAHLTQRWHGMRKMGFAAHGTYWASPWKGRNIVIYSDRPSKLAGGPCTHVEMRFYSTKQVRKLGAGSLVELLYVRAEELLRGQCVLSKPHAELVNRNIEDLINRTAIAWRKAGQLPRGRLYKRFRHECRADVARKVRATIARGLAHGVAGDVPADLSDAPAQVWLEGYRKLVGRAVAQVPFPSVPLFNSPGHAPPA